MNELVPLYKEMAAGGASFRGLTLLQSMKAIRKVVREHGIASVLDFGSGAGDAYRSPHKVHHEWGLRRAAVTLYDPAFPQHEELPSRKFDLVICSDVLEHIPEADVDAFLGTVFERAKRVVWASVCCRPARKSFPDGRNLHITVQPFEWWDARFQAACEHFGITGYLVDSP